MIVNGIIAIDSNDLIGVNNEMPWHSSKDFKYFKSMTLGCPIIMGRKTFDSIGRKALPKRKNIIISRSETAQYEENIFVVQSIEAAIELAKEEGTEKCFIIGGNQIIDYSIKNNLINNMYITMVDTEIEINENDKNIYFNSNLIDEWEVEVNEIFLHRDDLSGKEKHDLYFTVAKRN